MFTARPSLSRRDFLHTLVGAAAAAPLAGCVLSREAGPDARSPNVLLVMTDDQG